MAVWVESLQTRKKILDPYKELILSWLNEHPDLTAAEVQYWLIERHKKRIRSDTWFTHGEQIQVDFGHTKQKTSDNKEMKLNFIAFVLSNSRYTYQEWLDRSFTGNYKIPNTKKDRSKCPPWKSNT